MRIFALSDLHVGHTANARWIKSLSRGDYLDDVLILAGDVSDSLQELEWCLNQLASRFKTLLFVPGNHELWVRRDGEHADSMEKFQRVRETAQRGGASLHPFRCARLSIVPLQGWYDYTFGLPTADLKLSWADFHACRWPDSWSMEDVTTQFLGMNGYRRHSDDEIVISFSHFVPRIDVLSELARNINRSLLPVLGATRLEQRVRELRSIIHVYGHSHINRSVILSDTLYVNNALAYPSEAHIAARQLRCIFEYP
jgi:predicted phosphodiesterase